LLAVVPLHALTSNGIAGSQPVPRDREFRYEPARVFVARGPVG